MKKVSGEYATASSNRLHQCSIIISHSNEKKMLIKRLSMGLKWLYTVLSSQTIEWLGLTYSPCLKLFKFPFKHCTLNGNGYRYQYLNKVQQ